MTKIFLSPLAHPYARYGLAVALLQGGEPLEDLSVERVNEILVEAIETGLGHFRLATQDRPETTEVLRFEYIKLAELQRDGKLIQSAGLASTGKYLAPTVVTTDGDAKGTYDNAVKIAFLLTEGARLESDFTLSRSFAPTTAKINNGKSSQSPPKATLFESACSVITTLTPNKPAAWVDKLNTVIIPDLPVVEVIDGIIHYPLKDFVELFERMMSSELKELKTANLPSKKPASEESKTKKTRKKKSEDVTPKSDYRRPRLHNGNYPFAPRDAAFGAVGLLAAIGRWAHRGGQVSWAKRALESIAGTKEKAGRPLYIISYDSIKQVQFTHHVVGLSLNGELSTMVEKLVRETQLYADQDYGRPNRQSNEHKTNYKMFDLMASRFLQQFSPTAFRDFLSIRAEYAPEIQPLFKEYFMEAKGIPGDVVKAAAALGRWINYAAYSAAKEVFEKDEQKLRKEKAKILASLESLTMSAKRPHEITSRVITQTGRLTYKQQEMPVEAKPYVDAVLDGTVSIDEAKGLLLSYMRLRTVKAGETKPSGFDEHAKDT